MTITLNSDMGEGFGIYDFGNDAGLMRVIDIANVACGFHASDFNHMRKTVRMARENGVQVGAHVSLPDLQGFGRREMKMARQDLVNCIVYQTGALCGFLFAEGLKLNHIKAHGALYGMASRDPEVAGAIAEVAALYDVPVLGLAATFHQTACLEKGVAFQSEFFPDLDYDEKGQLMISPKAPDVPPEIAARRVRDALSHGIPVAQGSVPVETICIHSDRSNSIAVAEAVARTIGTFNPKIADA